MTIHFVTDSSSDLTVERRQGLAITVVPLSIRFGQDEYTDGVDLDVAEFYEKLAASTVMPETAAPAPGAFVAAFEAAFEGGASTVISINLSGALSATIQAARTAAATMPDRDVRVLDSASVTWGLGALVVAAAEAAAAGADADTVEALVTDLSPRSRVYGSLDTLEYLKRGGRIGGARAALGSLLSIKPVITIIDGVVEEAAKTRTRGKALQYLVDVATAHPGLERLAVIHGEAPDVGVLVDRLHEAGIDDVEVVPLGPVVGVHTGPGGIGLAFLAPG